MCKEKASCLVEGEEERSLEEPWAHNILRCTIKFSRLQESQQCLSANTRHWHSLQLTLLPRSNVILVSVWNELVQWT
ncbi:hypothetical protein F0562_022140 [Nyssa sinensis]|uniref:Uncharacterized protein n=1 Tax=Nyssa sinensis TaxID=561372 RepID=A0A5J5BN06_9ASTE|nr:hypothetical protein F0562_022140 [Nyssa sinensis]